MKDIELNDPNLLKEISRAEVALHDNESDCWVIVHGTVINVTDFLPSHPGGVGALSKSGRAGCDVSAHFDRIGHSPNAYSILRSMRIGVVAKEESALDNISEQDTLLPKKNDVRARASNWHALRRKAILRDHPEVAELSGSNPWTVLLGFFVVYVHTKTCFFAQREDVPWYAVIFLAYSIGAVCKMWQFAICHDVCHGTAGRWVEAYRPLKSCLLHTLTLPSLGGTTHGYYAHQHIGHHTSLGAQCIADIGAQVTDSEEAWNSILFAPDSDGDVLSIGSSSFGRILINWGTAISHSDVSFEDTLEKHSSKRYIHHQEPGFLEGHRTKLLKVMIIQGVHVLHHWGLNTIYAYGLMMPPPCAIFTLFFPKTAMRLFHKLFECQPESALHQLPHYARTKLVYLIVEVGSSMGLHTWIWVVLLWWLLFTSHQGAWTIASVMKGFFYLELSELFLYGFGLHPFMGFFLGTHRSGGKGFEVTSDKKIDAEIVVPSSSSSVMKKASKADDIAQSSLLEKGGADMALFDPLSATSGGSTTACQPTMSTYSVLASIASLNLTHHVEHHDFPSVPWNRLPMITKLAPEYYDSLEQSPGFIATIRQWIDHSEGWSYACQ